MWKTVPNYPNYEVSNLGDIRNKVTHKKKKPSINGKGYLYIRLWKNNQSKTYMVETLVATLFVGNPNRYKETNHIDEHRTRNRVYNLEWCSRKYNINYGNRSANYTKNKSIIAYKVICLDINESYSSIRKASFATQTNWEGIKNCCEGNYGSAYSHKYKKKLRWRYLEEVNE